MARFTQYPVATDPTDYTEATNFLIEAPDGDIKLASLEGLSGYFCDLKCATVSIPSAEVLTLNSVPVEIVAAQGAGTIIDPISAVALMSNLTTPYATNVFFQIKLSTATQPIFNSGVFINRVIASPSYEKFQPTQSTITSNDNMVANQPLVATVGTGNPTAGDGDIQLWVYYRVITV